MQPSSFQYQPINIQRGLNKAPNFIINKALDKSAPSITQNKLTGFISNQPPNKDTEFNQSSNKSAYTPKKDDLSNFAVTPKNFIDKNGSLNNLSTPALKFYHNSQLNKNQQKVDRLIKNQMAKSLIVQQLELNSVPNFPQNIKKSFQTTKQSSPPTKRLPRMSEGYQPYQNNLFEQFAINSSQTPAQSEFESKFMKVKKYNQNESTQKKLNIPAFLAKNSREANNMKRSTMQMVASEGQFSTQKSLSNSYSSLFASCSKKKKVSANDFQKIKELGHGKYGRVYLAREKYTGFICALKSIEKNLLIKEEITEQFIRQLKIQMYLNHPNIIKMYGYFDDDKNIYIILQVGTGGQLYHYLKKSQSVPEAKVAFLMKQICEAVNQIHSLRIIHRDIKPQNIVLHDNIIKLCDFGWSVHQDNKLRTTFCGTPLYVCPEILRGKEYDEKIDIWSLGIMMYEMVVGQNPFKITKQQELIKIIKDEIKIPSYVFVSSEARDFLDKCLQKNPNDRVSIRQLINHEFFKKHQQKEKKSFNL